MKTIFEVFSKLLILIGIVMLIILSYKFISEKDLDSFSKFGGSVGGLIGSLWSLAGILLFYLALSEQRKDIKINQDTLKSQIKSLDLQINEYKLQRVELEETRKVLKEQSNTFRIQQFESTFFNMMKLLQEIISELQVDFNGQKGEGRDFFLIAFRNLQYFVQQYNNLNHDKEEIIKKTHFLEMLMQKDNSPNSEIKENDLERFRHKTVEIYEDFYKSYHHNLGHYFRFLFNIMKFTIHSELNENEKARYINLIQAQMSSYELGLIFYNALSRHGNKMYQWIENYSFLENLDSKALLSPLIHIRFYPGIRFKFIDLKNYGSW